MISVEKLQEFRNQLLDLAIRGKLVEQRPEEGTAEELYKQIQEEKQKLIAEGKIKKEKPLPEITEEEIPFEIPESWKWVRLKNIVYNHGQKQPSSDFSYIEINSINNIHQRLSECEYIISADKAPSRARKIVKKGDIIYSTVRPYLHNMCIIDREFSKEPIASTGFAVLTCISGVYNKFLFNYLRSLEFDKYANDTDNSKGVAYPAINDKKFYKALVPLPPLSEQKRIVAKLESYLAVIDKAEELIERKANLDEEFRNQLLDLAIRGKLVEQRPEEGTAEELYAQIQEEKKKLIDDGKIKKEKPLPEIKNEEIPFDIPESWKWVRIGQIYTLQAGTNIKADLIQDTPSEKFQYKCYGGNGIRGYVSNYNHNGNFPIIGRQGALCGNIKHASGYFYATEHAVCVSTFSNTSVKLTCFFLKVLNLNQYSTSTAQPGLSVEKINKVLVPLPPLSEQKRIVAKIEELLPYCDKLK